MDRKVLIMILACTRLCPDSPIKDITYTITNDTQTPMDVAWDSGDADHPQYARNGKFSLSAGKSGTMTVWQSNCLNSVAVQSQIKSEDKASITNICFAAPMHIVYEGSTLKVTKDDSKMQLPQ